MIRRLLNIWRVSKVLTVFLCSLIILAGCVSASKKGVVSSQPLTTSEESAKEYEEKSSFPKNVAVLPFANLTKNSEAGRAVRQTLFNHFASKNYLSLHTQEVDRRMGLANLEATQNMDQDKIKQIADALKVDGLILGEVTHYDKVFVGVYAQVAVGVKLRFVSRDGMLIWEGEQVMRKHEGGISLSPIGIILQVVASAMHIQDINLFRASDELGRQIVAKIPEPTRLATGLMQNIKRVVHDGFGRHLRFGDVLNIAIEGTPGQKGFARIQGLPVVPLIEGESGFYSGEMVVPDDVDLEAVVVTGILEDDHGQRGEKIATTGYVFIDNTPPNPIKALQIESRDQKINLSWQSPGDRDVEGFEVMSASTAQGPFETLLTTRDNHYEQSGLENFVSVYYKIFAVDKAGNRSQPVLGEGRPLPDPRFLSAEPLPQFIPDILNGTHLLTAAGGPYLLQGRVDITPSAVLLVEPGSEIKLAASGYFMVQGELKIFGSAAKPVKVGGRDGMAFGTFVKLDGEKPVLIRGLELNQGGIPFVISRGKPYIEQVKVLQSSYHAFEIKGSSQPVIRASTVSGGFGGVAIITEQARPQFEKNIFSNNGPVHIQCNAPYLIKAHGNSWQKPDISSRAALLTSNGCTIELE
ncbi:MAG: right-handed parallel beta-helix repeat-containing protein [Magnetococcales bacterium]|nr:right-handed parallel beta-helix repeat-containing protein [Magnetococcales bacterium]